MHHSNASHVPVLPRPGVFYALAGGLLALFLVWSWFVFESDAIQRFDEQTASHWKRWSESQPGTFKYMQFFTELGGVASMTLLVVLGLIWQTSLNRRLVAIAWLVIVLGGGLVNVVCKEMYDRARPPESLRHAAVHERNKSYPSGHAMGSAIGFGMLGYALILPQRHRSRRVITLLCVCGIVLMIGFSRVFLRAHWFSDVIGGWTVGLAWLCFCLGVLERYRRKMIPSMSVTNPAHG